MAKLEINGKNAWLEFDMTSWEEMEETVGLLDEFDALMEGRQRLQNMRTVAAILSREGARLGKGEEMTADWLKENLRPNQVRKLGTAIRVAISDGMAMETKKGDDQAVDAIMAELEKKEEPDA